jgi:hypothetical protein
LPVDADAGHRAYLVSGATLDGASIGPMFATAREAHDVARQAITGIGGTVRILRNLEGWREVARYTDTGKRPTERRTPVVTFTIMPKFSRSRDARRR